MSAATKRLPFARFAALLPPRQQIFNDVPARVTVQEAIASNAQIAPAMLPVFTSLPYEGVERLTRHRACVVYDDNVLTAIYTKDAPNAREYLKNKAHGIVNEAVLRGKLADLKQYNVGCVDCDQRATDYDHRDYTRPLEVDPVCRSCNIKRGAATY